MNSYAPTLGFNNPKLTLKALGLCNTNPVQGLNQIFNSDPGLSLRCSLS